MRAVLQRVTGATVHVDGKLISRIGPGLVALIGIGTEDTADEIAPLTSKIVGTKLWNEGLKASNVTVPPQYNVVDDEHGQQQQQPTSTATCSSSAAQAGGTSATPAAARSEQVWGGKPWKTNVMEFEGEILCISQFTLHARLNKGTKPDFHRSMGGEQAKALYEELLSKLRSTYQADRVKDGLFGAMMACSLTNDGPVTILVDTAEKK